ncbi:MAG: tetratricopeptide repeat protein [Acidobacteriota bacterium]
MKRRVAALLLLWALAWPAWAASARRLNEEGNQAYRSVDFDAALRAYTEAQVRDPDNAVIQYNIGNVFYRQREYERASEAYSKAVDSAQGTLDRDASYNLGNSRFLAQDFAAAVQAYREALRIDPSDRDAKRNLEIALGRLEPPPPQEGAGERKERNQNESEPQSPPPAAGTQSEPPQEPPRPRQDELGREEAERLLEGLAQEERDNLKRQRRPARARAPGGKDW